MQRAGKIRILTGIAVLAVITTLALEPIPQDPAYHEFADQRTLFGIRNFWNVITNLPFIIFGLAGLGFLSTDKLHGGLQPLIMNYRLFFAGAILIGIGSGGYHLHPANQSLVWDRLPITIAMMSLFSAVLGENISVHAGRLSLWLLIGAGIVSVAYWHVTEQAGHGDLRFYVLIQFLPLLLIPIIMRLFKSPFASNLMLLCMLIAYVLAKIAEVYDFEIYGSTGVLSGHSLKHLFASLAVWFFHLALRQRRMKTDLDFSS
jgi:Alkaline phytoceramidase (aPHC).